MDAARTWQPGKVIDRSQVTEAWAGTPLARFATWPLPGWPQSAESQMIRLSDITTTCSWPGSKVQLPADVETA